MAKARKKQPFDVQVFLNTVAKGRTVSRYGKNRKVFSQGDPGDSVFYIQEGKVKVCVVSEQGKEAVVALHGNGEFFGESCLNGHRLRVATVVTLTESVIIRIEKAAIVSVLHEEPKFSEMFMAYLLSRQSRVEEDLVDQLFNSSEKRLARVLLLMANFGKEDKPVPIIAKISQETSRRSLARAAGLGAFRQRAHPNVLLASTNPSHFAYFRHFLETIHRKGGGALAQTA